MPDERFNLIFQAQDLASATIASIGSSLGKMAVAFASVGAVAAFLKSSVSEAAESQRVFAQLGRTIEAHGGSWQKAEAGVRSFATNLMLRTGESDEAIATSIKTFLDYGASGTQAYERVALAIDIARSKNLDLETVTQALARAQIGVTRGLIQLGLKLNDATDSAIPFAEIMRQLRDLHGGAVVAQMGTYADQVQRFATQWGEFKELIGGPMIVALSGFVGQLNNLAVVVNSNLTVLQKLSILLPVFTEGAVGVAKLSGAAAIAASGMGMLGKEIEGVGEMLGPPTAEFERSKKTLEEWTKEAKKATEIWNAWMSRRGELLEGMAPWEGQEGIFRFPSMPEEVQGPDTSELYRSWGMAWEKEAETIKQKQEEVAQFITGVSANAMNAIVDQFMAGRIRLAQVFKGMARDFISYFVQEIAKRIGAKLAGILFGAAFGSPVGAVAGYIGGSAMGDWTGGGESYGKRGVGGAGAASANPILVINIPMQTTQDFVRKQIIPELNRLRSAGAY